MTPFNPDVLFEDNYMLAINKPHGVVVESDKDTEASLQIQALRYIQSKEKYPQKCFIGVPHRLDKAVSGVVLFAKKKSVLKQLSELFSKRDIKKTYLAIVENTPAVKEAELVNWLVKDDAKRKATIHKKEVQRSDKVSLRYKLISSHNNTSLLQVDLLTGKYHQIRAQLSNIGCPVVGDAHYGSITKYKPDGICLHAKSLSFIHPVTNMQTEITAPLPQDVTWSDFNSFVS